MPTDPLLGDPSVVVRSTMGDVHLDKTNSKYDSHTTVSKKLFARSYIKITQPSHVGTIIEYSEHRVVQFV